MEERIRELLEYAEIRAALIVAGAIIAATIVEWVIRRTVLVLVSRTRSDVDDEILAALRRPIFISVVLVGLAWASRELLVSSLVEIVQSILATLAVLVWSAAAFRVSAALLTMMSKRGSGTSIIQTRTIPIFDMLLKVTVVGAALYFSFLVWRIDLTAWLASAGIIGIAIGFAAKDTLANLFAGIFIVADAPYKVGDFIVLDGGLRGRVTKIGVRSTRVLTRDDIEVTVPNAVIGNSSIVNETGGPYTKQRVRVGVDCAYGSDIDKIREVLLSCPIGVEHVVAEPEPQVRFLEFGASGLRFELRVWIEEPVLRGRVLDSLHCRIYKAFQAAGIEIPFSQHDLHIKELPSQLRPFVSRE
jgi:MscS family membrane protein